jgi:hypothetical protein
VMLARIGRSHRRSSSNSITASAPLRWTSTPMASPSQR